MLSLIMIVSESDSTSFWREMNPISHRVFRILMNVLLAGLSLLQTVCSLMSNAVRALLDEEGARQVYKLTKLNNQQCIQFLEDHIQNDWKILLQVSHSPMQELN